MSNRVKFAIKHQDYGECDIDVPMMVKHFDKKCFLSRWKDEYTFCRQPRKSFSIKCRIKADDARELIECLGLIEIRSAVFASGATYRLPENPE